MKATAGRRIWACLAGLTLCALSAGGCHEEGDVVVTALTFDGNHAFASSQLSSLLVTHATGRLPWSTRRYFDRVEFESDLRRLQAFYADRGYPAARVARVAVDMNPDKTKVKLAVTIDEGQPVIVEALRLSGFDSLTDKERGSLEGTGLRPGQPRDQAVIRVTRTAATNLLRDRGFARAQVDAHELPGSGPGRVVIAFEAQPGPSMTFGEISVVGLERVQRRVIDRELTFKTGEVYRRSRVTASQRRLTGLQLFELANIDDHRDDPAAPGAVPVRITVAEGPPRRLQLGVGYGSEDRVRATLRWTHHNWLGGGRLADVDAKWSRIDRAVTLTTSQTHFLAPAMSLQASVSAGQTQELTFSSNSYGGRVGLVYRLERAQPAEIRPPVRYQFRSTYVHEYLRYGIKPTALADVSRRDERIALGLDPETGRARGTQASIDFDVERTALDEPLDPHRGSVVSLHLDHAATWLGGTYIFNEIVGEGRGYLPIAKKLTLAVRGRFGTLAAHDETTVPFSARYFLGGSTGLRGWGRFQVSPLDDEGRPVGGRTLMEVTAEVRVPLRDKLIGVAFLDGGNVWKDDWALRPRDLRWDVGAGLRYHTPVGLIRGDFGYQLTPIDGLVVNGQPALRLWRIHFSLGQAF